MRHGLLLLLCISSTYCAAQSTLKAKAFPGAAALPLIVGVTHGFFEKHGLRVEPLFTQSSQEQRDDLANGVVQIAHTAVDNAVPMLERAKHDVVIVAGGDSSMNEFFVQPDVRSFEDIRGRTLVVDSPDTAYALQARKILLMNGLKAGVDYKMYSAGNTGLRYRAMQENREYAAAMLGPPISASASSAGFRSLGRAVDLLGAYQAGGVVAHMQGFRNVLALRAELEGEGDWGGNPPAPEKYLDLHYYDNALKRVSR